MSQATILKVSNMPNGVSRLKLKEVFRGIKMNTDDIFFSFRDDSTAYLVINDQEEASKAMFRSGSFVGDKKISILLSNLNDMNKETEAKSPRSVPAKPVKKVERDRSFNRDIVKKRPKPGKPYDRSPNQRPNRHPEMPVQGDYPKPPFNRGQPNEALPYNRRPEAGIDQIENFVLLTGIPYSADELEIQDFLKGILTRKVHLIRNKSGRFTGKPCGDALLEFFDEKDVTSALQKHGEKFGHRTAHVRKATMMEVRDILEGERLLSMSLNPGMPPPELMGPPPPQPPVNNPAPQLQNLLNLLGTLSNAQTNMPYHGNGPMHGPGPEFVEFGDPVTMRVAESANINRDDIQGKRVVGIRNLPQSVTPHEIVDFFRGFYVIHDSVRIHYLDNGKSSGDALVSFRNHAEANHAVKALDKRPVGHKKVDLFIL